MLILMLHQKLQRLKLKDLKPVCVSMTSRKFLEGNQRFLQSPRSGSGFDKLLPISIKPFQIKQLNYETEHLSNRSHPWQQPLCEVAIQLGQNNNSRIS